MGGAPSHESNKGPPACPAGLVAVAAAAAAASACPGGGGGSVKADLDRASGVRASGDAGESEAKPGTGMMVGTIPSESESTNLSHMFVQKKTISRFDWDYDLLIFPCCPRFARFVLVA